MNHCDCESVLTLTTYSNHILLRGKLVKHPITVKCFTLTSERIWLQNLPRTGWKI